MEWDTTTAHAVVDKSSKRLKKYKSNKFTSPLYNKEVLLNEWFVVN